MTTYAHDDLKRILELHRKWYYGEEGGERANLAHANLAHANLDGANLAHANLAHANLAHASLDGASLVGANLAHANLAHANLDGASLVGANLVGANLDGASLAHANLAHASLDGAKINDNTILSDGVTWKQYLDEVVPALLVAGGKALTDVANEDVWNCHSWENCPMHAAFGASRLSDVPAIYRWQAERFVQLFDAKLIPLPQMAMEIANA